jgi:hypothetical protein
MAYTSCKLPKYSVDDTFEMLLHILIVLAVIGWITGIGIPWALKLAVLAMCYMIFRYDYVPRCLPVLPICLVTDLQYLFNNAFPRHLCEMLPALVRVPNTCVPGRFADVTYNSCPRDELGILGPALFLLRWKIPTAFTTVFGHTDWGPTIASYIKAIADGGAVTALQITCAKLAFFDIIIVLVALRIAASIAPALMAASTKAVIASMASITNAAPYILNE